MRGPVDRRTPRQRWRGQGRVHCPDCGGTGEVGSVDHVLRCPTCRGAGMVSEYLAFAALRPFCATVEPLTGAANTGQG